MAIPLPYIQEVGKALQRFPVFGQQLHFPFFEVQKNIVHLH